jgi:hypothetical protein
MYLLRRPWSTVLSVQHAKSVQKEVPASPEAARDNTAPGPGSGPTIGIRRKHGVPPDLYPYQGQGEGHVVFFRDRV